MRVALLGLALLVVGCAARQACPVYAGPAVERAFLWRVTGSLGSMVIQGTFQAADGSDLSQQAVMELDQANLYVVEAEEASGHEKADPDDPAPMFHLPAERSLQGMLSAEDFRALREYIGIEGHALSRMKPWVAFMLLGRSQFEFPTRNINAHLLERARFKKKRVVFLESWDDQVAYLDAAITPAKLTAAVRGAPAMGCDIDRRLKAFRAGDDAVFANDVIPGEAVTTRIELWYGKLRVIVDRGARSFAALGIGQLVGPYGLLARFAADGYTVQRL